jgi:subtilisin family serine protease
MKKSVFFLLFSCVFFSFRAQAAILPNDPLFLKSQWGILNLGQPDAWQTQGTPFFDAGIGNLWEKSTGSRNVIVAVIDYGVDTQHPDLKDNLLPGYDFCHDKAGAHEGSPENWHGTFVSGVIGAEGNNGEGISGVNWHVSILPLKVFDGTNDCGDDNQIIRAIDYAVAQGARVINASWGGPQDNKALYNAIKRARDKGVLFVTTAGNDGKNIDEKANKHYPASYDLDNIITVTAADHNGALWQSNGWGANFGPKSVHLAAPGVEVWSTVPGGGYDRRSGTSFAAPYVSGAAALLLSLHPEWDYKTLRSRLLEDALPVAALEGKVKFGFLRADAALDGVKPAPVSYDVSSWESRPVQAGSSHPYDPTKELSFRVSEPGAKMIALHFKQISLGKARLYVKNALGARVPYEVSDKDGSFTLPMVGDSAWISFLPNKKEASPGYGFEIDRLQFVK